MNPPSHLENPISHLRNPASYLRNPPSHLENLPNHLKETVTRCRLPKPPARLLVALSGGADSVALLLLLLEAGYKLTAAHCNFHLRGAESDADETFCRRLCDKHGIALHVNHFDTAAEAARSGESIEMTARRLRYDWFGHLLDATGCVAVAVAHHRDDNVETLLLNLARGSGLHGLTGMRHTNGRVVRPLLDVPRRYLLDFLSARGQDYVTDSTNADTVYKRNLVRHEILPLLRRLNPAADETLAATLVRLTEADELCNRMVECVRATLPLVDGGADLPLPDTVVATPVGDVRVSHMLFYELLRPYGFRPAVAADMASGGNYRDGALFEAPGFLAVVHRGRMEVRPRPVRFGRTAVGVPGRTTLPDGTQLETRLLERASLTAIPREADTACLDADCLTPGLHCRSVERGDRFAPYGMRGTKLVSDFLTDLGLSRVGRCGARVLCDGNGILWIVGRRPDRRAAITDATRRVLLVRVCRN